MEFEKTIVKAIVNHNREYGGNYMRYSVGLKVLDMRFLEIVDCYDGGQMITVEVKTKFKAHKYENNIVYYFVRLYTRGDILVHFEKTEYEC